MIVRPVASSVRRFAVCARIRLPATVRLPSKFASFVQMYATGVRNNVVSKTWITASFVPSRVVVALRHAAKWPLDLKKPIGTNVRRNRYLTFSGSSNNLFTKYGSNNSIPIASPRIYSPLTPSVRYLKSLIIGTRRYYSPMSKTFASTKHGLRVDPDAVAPWYWRKANRYC